MLKIVYITAAEHGCRGPLSYLRGSRAGLRCPRNQPLALWQLLQQSLADRRLYAKLHPLANTQIFDMSIASQSAINTPPPAHLTAWHDTPFYNPETGLLSGPEQTLPQSPDPWSRPPRTNNTNLSTPARQPYSSHYFVQLQRNRQILRAILALDMEENLDKDGELQSLKPSSSFHDPALFGAVDQTTNQRRRGMLDITQLTNNSSINLDDLDSHNMIRHETLEKAAGLAPLSRGLVNPPLPFTDDSSHSSSLENSSKRRSSSNHRRRGSKNGAESRTWSAHIVLTTEMPRPTLAPLPLPAPARVQR